VSRYHKKHSPIHHPHHPVFISFFHLPRSICSNYMLGNLFAQPLSMSSLVYLLVWSPPLHIPYISSPSQCLLFASHAHTIPTSMAFVFTARHNAHIASAVLATAIPSVCLVTRRYCVKTTAHSTVQFALSDSKMCLVL